MGGLYTNEWEIGIHNGGVEGANAKSPHIQPEKKCPLLEHTPYTLSFFSPSPLWSLSPRTTRWGPTVHSLSHFSPRPRGVRGLQGPQQLQ